VRDSYDFVNHSPIEVKEMSDRKGGFSKRDAERAAGALRRSREWNPEEVLARRKDPLAQLRQEGLENKTAEAYEATDSCAQCVAEREDSGDGTALCEAHFSALMDEG